MRRCVIAILLFTGLSFRASADHITGGEMYYTYSGSSGGIYHYNVTLKLFMRCNSGRFFANPNIISIFDKATNTRFTDISVPLAHQARISLPDAGPCIENPPVVCYEVGYYDFTVSLPASSSGYVIASHVNFRINGITNILTGNVGATYTCEIPGNSVITSGPANHSAVFTGSDLVVVCANNSFTYSFGAADPDGDQLSYSFCSAYTSSSISTGTPPGLPPYTHTTYIGSYTETSPLGNVVLVNPATGLISGIAPPLGIYVVTVCVQEIRNGVVIATQRKDIQINVADCNIAAATLQQEYMLCRNTRAITIGNLSNNPLIISQDWVVLDPAGIVIYTSANPILTYTFPGNGTYSVKLYVNRGQQCSDSTEAAVFVYPGFIPDFDYAGICISKPSVFTDRTTTATGTINSWGWDFGDQSTTSDVSSLQDPSYTYPALGAVNVRLIVTNTDGCRDTAFKIVTIIEKPPINLAFRDTLICLNDQLQLQAGGMGNFTWFPNTNIINPTTSNPVVFPLTTTTYYADLDSDGCLNRDSVRVRVVDHVSLQVMNDTIICSGDTIQLKVISDGLKYSWTPAAQFINASVKNPMVITSTTTPYTVTAFIGGCSASAQVILTAIPLPIANAGNDTVICYGSTARLHAITDGTSWQWTPTTNPPSLNPIVTPLNTTAYIFTAYESSRGCPKPGRDTVLVTVMPKIIAYAGNDTAVVIGQSLQLTASGGVNYTWSPSDNLSATNIFNPIAIFGQPADGLSYRVKVFNSAGCADSAAITVRVFATGPAVFVPTGFTPNNDGKNDLLIPIAVGMERIEYFRVYNRWGQLVFNTTINGHGWNGLINGQPQASNTFVWIVKAIDYKGAAWFQKGHSTLIR